jgi:hypothetical protein
MMEKRRKKKKVLYKFFCSVRLMPGHVLNTLSRRKKKKKTVFFFPSSFPKSRSPSNHKKVRKKIKYRLQYTCTEGILQNLNGVGVVGGNSCVSLVEKVFSRRKNTGQTFEQLGT